MGPKRSGSLNIISLCILKESFSLKTLCIPQEYCFTQYYVWNNLDCNYNKILLIVLWKSYTKDWNGPLRPGAILVRNCQNDIFIRKCLKYRVYSIRATFLNLVLKGHPTWLHWIDDRDTVKITGSFVQVLSQNYWKMHFYLLWITIKSPYQWYKSSLSKIFWCLRIQICKQVLGWSIDPLHKSHKAPNPHPTMHHFVTEICWKMVHCGLFVLCIVEFVRWMNYS